MPNSFSIFAHVHRMIQADTAALAMDNAAIYSLDENFISVYARDMLDVEGWFTAREHEPFYFVQRVIEDVQFLARFNYLQPRS